MCDSCVAMIATHPVAAFLHMQELVDKLDNAIDMVVDMQSAYDSMTMLAETFERSSGHWHDMYHMRANIHAPRRMRDDHLDYPCCCGRSFSTPETLHDHCYNR